LRQVGYINYQRISIELIGLVDIYIPRVFGTNLYVPLNTSTELSSPFLLVLFD